MKTVNRGQLLKWAKAGLLVVIESYHFYDGYGDVNEVVRNDHLPVRIRADYKDFRDGFCNLYADDFSTKSGRAYANEHGTITLIVHSNCSYKFRRISESN